jgi:hypothetical protein
MPTMQLVHEVEKLRENRPAAQLRQLVSPVDGW